MKNHTLVLLLCLLSINVIEAKEQIEQVVLRNGATASKKRVDEVWQALAALYHDDQQLFEMLILEGAQAGLSWETILKRRENYRLAFHQFDAHKIVSMTDSELASLKGNPGIIRNRLKINAARKNAEIFLKIQEEYGSFSVYIWSFVNNMTIKNHWQFFKDIPTSTPQSKALSKDLVKRGMTFVGPTIMYAFMQAVGMVNDHLTDCWRYNS